VSEAGRACCTPSREPGEAAPRSRGAPTPRNAAAQQVASQEDGSPRLERLPGGEFRMGTDSAEGFAEDGEGPSRLVRVAPLSMARTTVTNAQFRAFVRATRHVTQAEELGSSFVFWLQLPAPARQAARRTAAGLPWWVPVEGACWQRPFGPGSTILDRLDHPVVHVSWHDAQAFCDWSGTRLPSEAQWEYAARGGLEGARYPWGDDLADEGRGQCQIWRGRFPDQPAPGWAPAAVAAASFAPNGYGLYQMAGNVWEWCADWYSPRYHLDTSADEPLQSVPTGRRTMRGGSFLCHASYCNRYRVAGRSFNTPESAASNIGFRVAA